MTFHLGWNYVSCGETAQGLPYLQRSLDLAKPDDTFVGLVYGQLARGYYQIGRRAESLAVSRQGQRWFPQYAELVFLESILLGELGDLQGSEACLRRLLDPTAGYVATDMGLCSYKARQNLAVIYSRQRRFSEAEAEWRRVLAEQPGYVPAWLSLADLWLSAGRISDLEQAVQSLQAQASTPGIADLLQARVCLTRKDFAAAKECLNRAASIAALTPWARRMLGEVTKQESGA